MPDAPPKLDATADQVIRLLGLQNDAELKRLERMGLPKEGRNRYDINRVVQWMIQHHQSQVQLIESKRWIWTLSELSVLFGVTPHWLNKLAREKAMPREAHGQYDLRKVIPWLVNDLKRQVEDAKRGDESMQDAVKREQIAKANMAEIELAQMQRQVVMVNDAAPIARDAVASTMAKLMAGPRSWADNLVMRESPAEIENILRSEVHAACSELFRLADRIVGIAELQEGAEDGVENVQPAATAAVERVGAGVSGVESGKRKQNRTVEKRKGPVSGRHHGRDDKPRG